MSRRRSGRGCEPSRQGSCRDAERRLVVIGLVLSVVECRSRGGVGGGQAVNVGPAAASRPMPMRRRNEPDVVLKGCQRPTAAKGSAWAAGVVERGWTAGLPGRRVVRGTWLAERVALVRRRCSPAAISRTHRAGLVVMTRVEGSDGSATTRRCGWQRHRGAADNRARGNIHRRHARVQRRVAQNAVLRLPRLRGVTSKAMTGCGRRRWDGAAALKDGGVGAGRRGGALPFLPHLHPLALPAHPVLSTAPRAHHPGRTQQHTQSQVYTRADEQCLPRRRATTAFHVVRTPYFREEISITTSRRVRRSVPAKARLDSVALTANTNQGWDHTNGPMGLLYYCREAYHGFTHAHTKKGTEHTTASSTLAFTSALNAGRRETRAPPPPPVKCLEYSASSSRSQSASRWSGTPIGP